MSKAYEVALVVACANDNVIGYKNTLPWRVPSEMKHFQKLTMGHALIAGANTAKSIGPALKGRTCFVVADRDVGAFVEAGWIVFPTYAEALAGAVAVASRMPRDLLNGNAPPVVMVIGGEKLYREALPLADYVFMSRIDMNVPMADSYFPEFNLKQFIVHSKTSYLPLFAEGTGEEVTPGWQYSEYQRVDSFWGRVSYNAGMRPSFSTDWTNVMDRVNAVDMEGKPKPTPEDEQRLDAALNKIFGQEGNK